MRSAILVLAVLAVAAPAFASDSTDVTAVVKQFIDGFNAGNTQAALATCAPETAIIDEFPPYSWNGATGCADWARDFEGMTKQEGITEPKVTLGKPRHVDVAGDRAYVVVPADFKFKVKGKATAEKGSTLTVALQKLPAGWRMTAWAWAKH